MLTIKWVADLTAYSGVGGRAGSRPASTAPSTHSSGSIKSYYDDGEVRSAKGSLKQQQVPLRPTFEPSYGVGIVEKVRDLPPPEAAAQTDALPGAEGKRRKASRKKAGEAKSHELSEGKAKQAKGLAEGQEAPKASQKRGRKKKDADAGKPLQTTVPEEPAVEGKTKRAAKEKKAVSARKKGKAAVMTEREAVVLPGAYQPLEPLSAPEVIVAAREVPWELPVIDHVEGVTVVRDRKSAARAIQALYRHKDQVFACDTEVADLDVKSQGPVGNGRVICASVYGGPEVDFGEGKGKVLWIDNMNESEGLLQEFRRWLQDTSTKKVWHNFGFDRHVVYNEGQLDCLGFAGDTMHMARLWDTSRDRAAPSKAAVKKVKPAEGSKNGNGNGNGNGGAEEDLPEDSKGYSLEALSKLLVPQFAKQASMKDLFGVRSKRKDGTEGNLVKVPPLRDVQADESVRGKWIKYSADDAMATWHLRKALEEKLRAVQWIIDGEVVGCMMDFYEKYFVPFGELLTDMERIGIRVDAKDYLANVQKQAEKDKEAALERFLAWASKYGEDMKYCNPASVAQMQTFLFGGSPDRNDVPIAKTRVFKIDIPEKYREEIEGKLAAAEVAKNNGKKELKDYKLDDLKKCCKENKLKVSGTKADLVARIEQFQRYGALGASAEEVMPMSDEMQQEFDDLEAASVEDLRHMCAARGLGTNGTREDLVQRYKEDMLYQKKLIDSYGRKQEEAKQEEQPSRVQEVMLFQLPVQPAAANKAPRKWFEIEVYGLGIKPEKYTAAGGPAVSATVLRKLAGNPSEGRWGTVYDHFNQTKEGEEACWALDALCNMGSIDTMISNFLVPLQELVDKNGRVHCSLNLNTETGRLSARRPNLQNQPALEKDQYKIRKAFISEPGKSLIVADYGQLELRLMAHITNCKSMIEAFREGGCFHSRTAVGMFEHVRKAVEAGEVLLEWDYSKGKPPAPLVKDKYGAERRKAKTLNFSIAYGKTAFGLAKDWGVSQTEAEQLLLAWYGDRAEVKQWQEKTIKAAKKGTWPRTLLGRYRVLNEITSRISSLRGHSERAAINTPIQGGAADVVMMAMLRIHNSKKLAELGWKLLLQIHDEVIVEGPDESKDEALEEVIRCMENPFDDKLTSLRVKLEVDAKVAKTWMDAK